MKRLNKMLDWRGLSSLLLPIIFLGDSILPFAQAANSTLRLVNGGLDYGTLEILIDDAWGTICDDSFSFTEAEVACRQLGLDSSLVDFYGQARFGEGEGPIWLDDLSCGGSESSLLECTHAGIGINDCSHSEDVAISCGRTDVEVPISTGGGGFSFSGTGSWIGFVVFFVIVFSAATAYRRRRLYQMRQQQRATTTIIQPPTTTVVQVPRGSNNPGGNSAMPTYYHGSGPQPVGSAAAGGPGPYPTQQYAPAAAYPPQSTPGANPYPVQAYPSAPQNPNAGTTPYPPQQAGEGGTPYPPQAANDPPPMYPPPTGPQEEDLPPPPSYNDIVKQ